MRRSAGAPFRRHLVYARCFAASQWIRTLPLRAIGCPPTTCTLAAAQHRCRPGSQPEIHSSARACTLAAAQHRCRPGSSARQQPRHPSIRLHNRSGDPAIRRTLRRALRGLCRHLEQCFSRTRESESDPLSTNLLDVTVFGPPTKKSQNHLATRHNINTHSDKEYSLRLLRASTPCHLCNKIVEQGIAPHFYCDPLCHECFQQAAAELAKAMLDLQPEYSIQISDDSAATCANCRREIRIQRFAAFHFNSRLCSTCLAEHTPQIAALLLLHQAAIETADGNHDTPGLLAVVLAYARLLHRLHDKKPDHLKNSTPRDAPQP